MKNALLVIVLAFCTAISFAQPLGNRFNYKYKIKQGTLDAYRHVLVLRAAPGAQSPNDPVYQVPAGRVRRGSITFDKGTILVDFWTIEDSLDIELNGNCIHKNAPHGVYEIKQASPRTTIG